MEQTYKSGFVSIIGCPNVGKSTLLNKLVGQKIAIVSNRPQTTRNKITGVLTRPGYQIVFLDTPGVAQPKNRLGDYMLSVSTEALREVEAVLLMIDPINGLRERDSALIDRVKQAKAPIIGVINKRDIASMEQMEAAKDFLFQAGICKETLSVSAETGDGLPALEQALCRYLIPGPQYFPEDMVTDQPERIIMGELIREKTLRLLREEIPHGVGVFVDKVERREDGLYDVWATIFCERDGHKGIIIGRGGAMLKRIGEAARHDIEWMLGERVNLQLWVKVKEDWRNSAGMLRELGYE